LDTLWFTRTSLHIGSKKYGWIHILQLRRGQTIMLNTFWLRKFWRCSTIKFFPSTKWITRAFYLISMQIRLVEGLSLGIEYGISTCTPSFKSSNMYMYGTIHEHFPKNRSSPMFQEHIDLSHFKLTTCPCNIHNQHWVKCTQNNPFIGLGSWAMTWAWFAWMGVYVYIYIIAASTYEVVLHIKMDIVRVCMEAKSSTWHYEPCMLIEYLCFMSHLSITLF
jgi:hypothetical protein